MDETKKVDLTVALPELGSLALGCTPSAWELSGDRPASHLLSGVISGHPPVATYDAEVFRKWPEFRRKLELVQIEVKEFGELL